MIIAIGIDIVDISRLEESFERSGDLFRDRVFTEAEIAYCERRARRSASYAARFAAKEATMKALGTGWAEGVGWRDIEVVSQENGKPTLKLSGRALELFQKMGAWKAHLTLSHSNDLAIAQV
ncbi:MAG TPA: holo-ACP synthase, partial [Blastocatellia bacterium]|nr:holo-ACP synthase [Blastocatellia bacterium]